MLMMRTGLVIVVLAACGGPEGAISAPNQPPPSNPGSRVDCRPPTDTAILAPVSRELPDGVTEDEVLLAVKQILFAAGTDTEQLDPVAKTLTSKSFTGRTLLMNCRPTNKYLVYAARVSVIGRVLRVSFDCSRSWGWEAGTYDGVYLDKRRGPIEPCGVTEIVGEGDATMPRMIADSALMIIDTDRIQKR